MSVMPVGEKYSGPLTATYIASHMKFQPSASSHGQMVKLANKPTSSQLNGNWLAYWKQVSNVVAVIEVEELLLLKAFFHCG